MSMRVSLSGLALTCYLCGEPISEVGRPRDGGDGKAYLFHEGCVDDEPSDTGGGLDPIDDGDEPEERL
jgi:hypothetical protein